MPDGRQVQRKVGPAWTERGRPVAGYFTKRTAELWLQELLSEVRRGTLPGMDQTGVTFADAADGWLRFIEEDRERKPSTLADYRSALRSRLLPAFGDRMVESITVAEAFEVESAPDRPGRLGTSWAATTQCVECMSGESGHVCDGTWRPRTST